MISHRPIKGSPGRFTRVMTISFLKWLIPGVWVCIPLLTGAQELLVNGDFEDENICTEYKVNCAPEAWICNKDGFSTYFKDYTRSCHGEHFLAIEIGHTSKNFQRTFSRTQLLCGLRKDHRYQLSFYVKSPFPVLDSMGVLFTPFDFLFGKKRLQQLRPSMYFRPVEGRFTEDSNWQHVSMEYTASGDEAYLSFASFAKLDYRGDGTLPKEAHLFVYVDDVSLVPLDPHEKLCIDTARRRLDIYEQDERHEFMRMKIRQNNDDPPMVTLPLTRMVTVDTLLLPDVLFASGRAELQPDSYAVLGDLLKKVAGKKIDSIVVEGHTDNRGSAAVNLKLSADRAMAIREVLGRDRAFSTVTVITRGWADRRPVAANTTAAGRQRNRRVELFVYASE